MIAHIGSIILVGRQPSNVLHCKECKYNQDIYSKASLVLPETLLDCSMQCSILNGPFFSSVEINDRDLHV